MKQTPDKCKPFIILSLELSDVKEEGFCSNKLNEGVEEAFKKIETEGSTMSCSY